MKQENLFVLKQYKMSILANSFPLCRFVSHRLSDVILFKENICVKYFLVDIKNYVSYPIHHLIYPSSLVCSNIPCVYPASFFLVDSKQIIFLSHLWVSGRWPWPHETNLISNSLIGFPILSIYALILVLWYDSVHSCHK